MPDEARRGGLDVVVEVDVARRAALARAAGAGVSDQLVGVADREQRARLAHRLLEEDLALAQALRETGLLEALEEGSAHAAEEHVDAERAQALEELRQEREPDRVGVAHALHA